jgi:hypothetical protein
MTHIDRQLSGGAQVGVTILGILQAAFAFLAAWDLWHRHDEDVKGSKWMWVPALFINWLGPGAYFLFGIKHENR